MVFIEFVELPLSVNLFNLHYFHHVVVIEYILFLEQFNTFFTESPSHIDVVVRSRCHRSQCYKFEEAVFDNYY